ncbi:MAG TPA: hypothetical protein DHV28_17405 [Ignavibacteriales bacterium]|nr:hypothetical protein [Ignavibacteriales bacterium]
MRDVRSRNYFQQMIGRGTRSFSKDELIKVTPSAKINKERFYIIDAVGVFKSVKVDYPVVDKKPTVPLKDLMKMVILQPDEDTMSSLAARLTKIDKQITETDREKFIELAEGKNLTEVALNLANVYDPDEIDKNVRRIFNLPVDAEPNAEQIHAAMRPCIQSAIRPFDNPKLREFLETVRQKIYQIIDETNTDRVIRSEFDTTAKENADEIINNFRKFIDDNKDEITALRILYSQPERRKELTYKMIRELSDALTNPPYYLTLEQVWNAYQRIKPNLVKSKSPQRMLTDIITLIRFELRLDETLEPYSEVVNRRFKEWVFKRNAGPVQFNDEQMNWLRMIKDHIVSSVRIEKDDFELSPFVDEGGLGKFYQLFGGETEKIITEINKELAA